MIEKEINGNACQRAKSRKKAYRQENPSGKPLLARFAIKRLAARVSAYCVVNGWDEERGCQYGKRLLDFRLHVEGGGRGAWGGCGEKAGTDQERCNLAACLVRVSCRRKCKLPGWVRGKGY